MNIIVYSWSFDSENSEIIIRVDSFSAYFSTHISLRNDCYVNSFKYTVIISSSFYQIYRVTGEAFKAETAVWPDFFLMNVFFVLKGFKRFIIICKFSSPFIFYMTDRAPVAYLNTECFYMYMLLQRLFSMLLQSLLFTYMYFVFTFHRVFLAVLCSNAVLVRICY